MTNEDLELRKFLAVELFGYKQEVNDHFVEPEENNDGYGLMHYKVEELPEWEATGDGMLAVIEAMRTLGYEITVWFTDTNRVIAFVSLDEDDDFTQLCVEKHKAEDTEAPLAVARAVKQALEAR